MGYIGMSAVESSPPYAGKEKVPDIHPNPEDVMFCRVVEIITNTRVILDDGPGIFRHINQIENRRVVGEWCTDGGASKEQLAYEASRYLGRFCECEEYVLEKMRDDNPDKWEFVSYL